jgi:hypothetical protein
MPDQLSSSEYIKVLVVFARTSLETLQVDTSDLDDLTMMTHLVVIMEIVNSKGMDGGLNQALTEYSDRFLDLRALAGEMMAAAEGMRH